MRILLCEEDFKKLTNGGVITKKDGEVEIALTDIGWYNMIRLIQDNIN